MKLKITLMISLNVISAGLSSLISMRLKSSISPLRLKEATLKAAEIAEAGDVVLLSPSTSSYDEFTGYEQRGRCFKEIVNSLECE